MVVIVDPEGAGKLPPVKSSLSVTGRGQVSVKYADVAPRICQGFVSSFGGEEVKSHPYYHPNGPLPNGSHGLCPDCKALYERDIELLLG